MLEPALENIRKVIEGDESISKEQSSTSKWLVGQVMAADKAALEDKMQRLKLKVQEKAAKDSGIVPQDDPIQKAKEFGGPRLITDYDPSWDEEEDTDD
jgi:hypothetical protein